MGLWKTGLSLPASDWVTFIVDFASELFVDVGPRLLFSGGRGTIFSGGWGVNSRERGKTKKKKGFFQLSYSKTRPLYIFSCATVFMFCYSNFQFSVFSFQLYPNGPYEKTHGKPTLSWDVFEKHLLYVFYFLVLESFKVAEVAWGVGHALVHQRWNPSFINR